MAELFNILTYNFESLDAPLNIAESNGDVTVITLTTPVVPAGTYEVMVSFVSSFTSVNDQLGFRITGDSASPDFLKEAKDSNESIPTSYIFPMVHATSGPINFALVAWIDGVGNADVTIEAANLTVKRVNGVGEEFLNALAGESHILLTTQVLSNRITRQDIINVLTENGISGLNRNRVFSIRSENKLFLIHYNVTDDEFYYNRMALAE